MGEEMTSWTERVTQWATDRNLIGGSEPRDQMLKLVEEMGELATAIQKKDRLGQIDAIGDCAVVLCIVAAQLGLGFDDCQEAAWSEIKDRKGRLIDGVFVKEVSEESVSSWLEPKMPEPRDQVFNNQ
jgi:NTP pyrophosphatase (non-canonical NTP hydrolase)